MRLSVLAALGVTAFLGIMAIDPPDANALSRRTTVVSSPRGTAIVSRTRGARGAVTVRGRRGTMIASRRLGARGAIITSRPRGAVVVRRRGTSM
jgi:hypothetical protein